MKNRAPAFQFYAADYLADAEVQLLSLEQEGAYIRLLAYCWREGSLPNDPEQLAKLCKNCSTDVITIVLRLFNEAPNDKTRLVHKRLEEERVKQQEHREQCSQAGKKSAEKRSHGPKTTTNVGTVVQRALNENPTLQSSSSSSSSTNQLTGSLVGQREVLKKAEPSNLINNGADALPAAPGAVPDIVHQIFQHYPNKARPKQSLEAIQKALLVEDGEVLLTVVKSFAKEMVRTNTLNPMWADVWFSKETWKSYLPVVEDLEPATPVQGESDQNFSTFPKEMYESN